MASLAWLVLFYIVCGDYTGIYWRPRPFIEAEDNLRGPLKERRDRTLQTKRNNAVVFTKVTFLMALMFWIHHTCAVLFWGRCCYACKEPLWCCDVLHLDEMQMEAREPHTQPGIASLPTDTHTHARAHTLKHTYICGMFVLTFLSFCLSLTHTHRGCFKPLSLPLAFLPAAASSNVFTPLPPPPPPSPPLHHEKTPPQKNHSLFLLYLPLTSKAHFSQRLPSVRY